MSTLRTWENRLVLTIVAILMLTLVSLCAAATIPARVPSMNPDSLALAQDSAYARLYDITPTLAGQIRVAAARWDIPDSIAYALVRVESEFKSRAISPVGAVGLSQVMPETGRLHCSLRRSDLFVPEKNLNCGFSFLALSRDFFGGDWRLALIGYNRGPGRTRRELERGRGHGSSSEYARYILALARRSPWPLALTVSTN